MKLYLIFGFIIFSFNPDTRMLELKISVNLDIKGQYRSFGKLLIFTINGEGDSIIKCSK